MICFKHTGLSKEDMKYLTGTPTMERLQRNRLTIAYFPKDTVLTQEQLGFSKCKDLYFVNEINSETLEILFHDADDMRSVEKRLLRHKLASDES